MIENIIANVDFVDDESNISYQLEIDKSIGNNLWVTIYYDVYPQHRSMSVLYEDIMYHNGLWHYERKKFGLSDSAADYVYRVCKNLIFV